MSCTKTNFPTVILESAYGEKDALCFRGRILPARARFDLVFENHRFTYTAKTVCCGDFDEFLIRAPFSQVIGGVFSFFLLKDGCKWSVDVKSGKFCPVTFLRFDWTRIGSAELYSIGKRHDCVGVKAPASTRLLPVREVLFELNAIMGRAPHASSALRCRRGLLSGKNRTGNQGESIWLISDRPMMGGDNGEALFRYLSTHPVDGVDARFVLRSDSPDYERISAIGPVVPYNSEEHAKLQSQATFIISSAADEFVINRFGSSRHLLKSVDKSHFVFLQHGVTKDDMSGWLNRWNKNICLFFTASEREKDSITGNAAYGYTDKEVKLTGFPRHDELLAMNERCANEKKILIAPTWRSNIAGKTISAKGTRIENPDFEASDYYLFYQSLINDPALLCAAKKMGYSIVFLIHPAFVQESHKFTSDFTIVKNKYDYRSEFSTSSILLTDYSSVAFDFALLKKPIVYSQSDSDKFYREHSWDRGYFDYQKDGFGEIACSIRETVDALIRYMDNPEMPKLYQDRVDDFFFFPEGVSRCELVAKAIAACDSSRATIR